MIEVGRGFSLAPPTRQDVSVKMLGRLLQVKECDFEPCLSGVSSLRNSDYSLIIGLGSGLSVSAVLCWDRRVVKINGWNFFNDFRAQFDFIS